MKDANSNQQQNLFPELVQVRGGQPVTTSLMVAEYFAKQHKDVLRAINLMDCSDVFRERNFAPSEYSRKNGNVTANYPMFYMTRDGFTFLVMGFTGRVAAKFKEDYINAFNTMEEKIQQELSAKQKRRDSINDLFKNSHNPNRYPQKYFIAILDSFSAFLSEEFDKGQWRGGTSDRLVSRIKAARTLYLE